jgi:hypothetical protein
MDKRTIITVFLLLVITLGLQACDNRPMASKEPLDLRASFWMSHLVDETVATPATIDTALMYLEGPGLTHRVKVTINGERMTLIGVGTSLMLFASGPAVTPSTEYIVEVSDDWQSASNVITTRATQPVLTQPPLDSTYERDSTIPVAWNATTGDDSPVIVDLLVNAQTIWTDTVVASTGFVDIPPSVWIAQSDTVGVVQVWRTLHATGGGLVYGMGLTSGLGVARTVKVRKLVIK